MLNVPEAKSEDVATLMAEIGRKARAASRPLALATAERKHAALVAMVEAIRDGENAILDAMPSTSPMARRRGFRLP